MAYHTVKHHLSYASTDCNVKLLSHIFPDSSIAKKVTCGKTKCEALIKGVLGPQSVKELTELLKVNDLNFGIGFDASNKGNQKCFPIAVRYFDESVGICCKVLDFYEDSDETAVSMAQQVVSRISSHDIKLSQISSLAADNTNANFGKNNSLYVHLKQKTPNLLKANCCAHIVHNTCKIGMNALSLDIEMLIIKLYNYFSSSAKRVSQLKDFFDFVNQEYSTLLRHVPTRWLSLKPAIDRLLQNLPAVISFFSSADDCPLFIQKHLLGEPDSEKQKLVVELYLHFCHHLTEMFQKAVLLLEKNELTICEVFDIISGLKVQLEQRLLDCFFGYQVRQSLTKMGEMFPGDENVYVNEFKHIYEVCINYLTKWFDFSSDNILSKMNCIALESSPKFEKLLTLAESLSLIDSINPDDMYSEVILITDIFSNEQGTCLKEKMSKLSVPERWVCVVELLGKSKLKNVLILIRFVLSIFPSNAFTERIFSMMKLKWRDDRNKCTISLIKNELLVYFNYNMTCTDFHKQVLLDKTVLQMARTNNKYVHL